MKFFPVAPVARGHAPFCKPAHDRGWIRPPRWPAERPHEEVVWSEAKGQLIDLATDARAEPAVPRHPTESPRHILIVDDDPALRELLTEVLRRAGYRVTCANDGEAGWAALGKDTFDVLIIDHDLPGLSGLDLLRRVRAGPSREVPVIVISGDMPWNETDLKWLLQSGMALEKPFSLMDLLAKVGSVSIPPTHAGEMRAGLPLLEFDRHQPPPLVPRLAG